MSIEFNSGVAKIVLSNPPLNVIDIGLMEEFAEALQEAGRRPDVAVLLLSGQGDCFSAGVDVAAHTPDKVETMLAKFHAVIRALLSTKKVTIASVRGHCLGGGAELAMVCDLVYTTESAQWGFPEIRLGCYPPVACTALAALVGQKRAAELILTGQSITGMEAAGMGLANNSVEESKLDAKVEEVVGHLKNLSPASLAVTKKAIYAWDAMHFDRGLGRAEKIYMDELMKTEDAHEGINAFLEKRQPNWKGK